MIKRHFPPPTFRSHFSPERALPPPPFAFKMTFPVEELSLPNTSHEPSIPEELDILGPPFSISQENGSRGSGLIPKPKGEVNRSDTYNLKSFCEERLGWSVAQFEEIQVSFVQSIEQVENDIWFMKKYLHELIDANLNKNTSRTQQKMEVKRLVYEKV